MLLILLHHSEGKEEDQQGENGGEWTAAVAAMHWRFKGLSDVSPA